VVRVRVITPNVAGFRPDSRVLEQREVELPDSRLAQGVASRISEPLEQLGRNPVRDRRRKELPDIERWARPAATSQPPRLCRRGPLGVRDLPHDGIEIVRLPLGGIQPGFGQITRAKDRASRQVGRKFRYRRPTSSRRLQATGTCGRPRPCARGLRRAHRGDSSRSWRHFPPKLCRSLK
jgi:hypothetical protein